MELVGFPKDAYGQSPFELSGGQKRRVAIAGVLAMEPKILVLDEPTAGLDPKGRDEILGQISHLQKETGISVVLVSHSMEDVANYVDRIVVMNHGKILFDDVPHRVQISHLQKETGISVVLVSHSMEDVANYVDRIVVMNHGKILFDDVPHRVFSHIRELEEVGLAAPQVTYILHDLKKSGFNVDTSATTIEEAKETILQAMKEEGKC